MKVKMRQSARGPTIRWNPGDVIELEADEAARFIAKGIAEPVKQRRRKAAFDPPPEQAVNE